MTHDERGAWLFGASVLLAYGVYLAIVVPRTWGRSVADVAYEAALLATFGSAILAGIILWVLLGRGGQGGETFRDARDHEITAYGERAGQGVVALAAMVALGLALRAVEPFWIANVLYLGFVLAALVSSLARIAAYRWGVPDS